jgi:hypothetical protein
MQEGNQVDFMVASYHANATAVEANIMIDILYKL